MIKRTHFSMLRCGRVARVKSINVIAAATVLLIAHGVAAESIQPKYKHVQYGPAEQDVMNVWIAPSKTPTPIVVMIHGGGWSGGAMEEALESDFFLSKGISVAAIEYRFVSVAPLPVPVHDAARAVQFIRSKAAEWNIDKSRLALMGGSAGGCTSLWLALHDDLANPKSDDPVERESTKPLCVAVGNAQTCIDPPVIRKWLGDVVLQYGMIWKCVGAASPEAALADYPKYEALYKEFSPINFLDKNDPPIFLTYGGAMAMPKAPNLAIHHPMFGVKFKEAADAAGLECTLDTREKRDTRYGSMQKFLTEHLTAKNPNP